MSALQKCQSNFESVSQILKVAVKFAKVAVTFETFEAVSG